MQKYKVYINKEPKIISDDWKNFCAHHTFIEAAGGVVFNHKKQILMIFRNGNWDLPKGKLEVNENIQECAIREVEEECGVYNLHIESKLQNTYHTYQQDGKSILKKTYWFKMNTSYNNNPIPQINEGITRAEWVNIQDLPKILKKSYGNIIDILIEYII